MMSPTSHPRRRRVIGQRQPKLSGRSFSALPSDAVDLGHARLGAGSICAAQPVTMIRALGRSRRSRRIAWRAWRSASAVTAQVLTITASPRPAAAARPRITSLSKAFSRQPKVMISTPHQPCIGEQLRLRTCPRSALAAGPVISHVAVAAASRSRARRRRASSRGAFARSGRGGAPPPARRRRRCRRPA